MTRLTFSPRAIEQVDAADEWWRENRQAAPMLFLDELMSTAEMAVANPEIGRPYPRPGNPKIRRLVMVRTRYHIYYEYRVEEDEIWVMDVWSSLRGTDPPL